MINVTGWRPIKEYFEGDYDWVLVQMMDGPEKCVPVVAEYRVSDNRWYASGYPEDLSLPFPVVEFFDMQELDPVLQYH